MKLIIYVVGLAMMITMAGCEIHEHEHEHAHYRGGAYDGAYHGSGRQVYPYDHDRYYWEHRY